MTTAPVTAGDGGTTTEGALVGTVGRLAGRYAPTNERDADPARTTRTTATTSAVPA